MCGAWAYPSLRRERGVRVTSPHQCRGIACAWVAGGRLGCGHFNAPKGCCGPAACAFFGCWPGTQACMQANLNCGASIPPSPLRLLLLLSLIPACVPACPLACSPRLRALLAAGTPRPSTRSCCTASRSWRPWERCEGREEGGHQRGGGRGHHRCGRGGDGRPVPMVPMLVGKAGGPEGGGGFVRCEDQGHGTDDDGVDRDGIMMRGVVGAAENAAGWR